MKSATILYNRHFAVGAIHRRMAGSFVEHLNRCVYGGLYEPEHPQADGLGFRKDVKRLIQEAGVSIIRYPGGNFVSGYHWKDGIGPRDKRPPRWDLAWETLESNQVGTDEMACYLRDIGVELMIAVNMGTGTPLEAAELVEYMNRPVGSYWSDLRSANGFPEPHGVKLWCIGNEMDGPWQVGRMNAADYADKYVETAKMMRRVDPSIELVAAGSCTNELQHLSFGHWDRTVLERAYEYVDYLSLHRYYGYDVQQSLMYPRVDTLRDVAYMAGDLESMLKTIIGVIDFVKGILHSSHNVYISFDELSLLPRMAALPDGTPIHEFSQLDAVLYGGLLCVLLCHADRVKIHCQSLVVNENGLYTTLPRGGVIPQPILYPFQDFACYARGVALRPEGMLPTEETEHYGPRRFITTACALDEKAGTVTVFLSNCSLRSDVALTLELQAFGPLEALEWICLSGSDPHARNTVQCPRAVRPEVKPLRAPNGHIFALQAPRHSWNVYRFQMVRPLS